MKRGIEILVMWLIIVVIAEAISPRSIPHNSFEGLIDRLAVISFPMGAWVYARHSGRLSPVICYGLIAGVLCVVGPMSAFEDSRGMARDLTLGWKIAIFGVPVLMTLLCVGVCLLRRYLDRDDEHHDA
jgi:hypothetical protein